MPTSQFWMHVPLALVMTAGLGGAKNAAAKPRIHDYTIEFLRYWDDARELPAAEQVAHFKSEVVPLFPEFYAYRFEAWRRAGLDSDAELARALEEFPLLETSFRTRAKEFAGRIDGALRSFKEAFPDFDDEIDVYVINSLFEMDGGTRTLGGRSYFLFGIDGMAKYHRGSDDLPFFHHELFHIYHQQHGAWNERLFESLWAEGLATYISSVLNPTADLEALMLDFPVGLVAQCTKVMEFLIADLTSRLESDAEEDYETYFLPSLEHERVPKRAGYYVGYLVAQELHASRSLPELVDLRDDGLLAAVREALTSIDRRLRQL